MTTPRFAPIEHKVWQHPDGRQVSGFSLPSGAGFALTAIGWAQYDRVAGVMVGPTEPTREAAQVQSDQMNERVAAYARTA